MTKRLFFVVLCSLLFGQAGFAMEPSTVEKHFILSRFESWLTGAPTVEDQIVGPGLKLMQSAHGDLALAMSAVGQPMVMNGRLFQHGVSVKAPAHIRFYLPPDAITFSTNAGIDTNQETKGLRGSAVFTVKVDGKQVWESQLMHGMDLPVKMETPVEKARYVDLIVSNGGDNDDFDHCDWGDAYVITSDGKRHWIETIKLIPNEWLGTGLPFSFILGGRNSSELLGSLEPKRLQEPLDEKRTQHTLTWLDETTGLEVSFQSVLFSDSAAIDWVVNLRNTGANDLSLLENILPLNMPLYRMKKENPFTLYSTRGSAAKPEDFEPIFTELPSQGEVRIGSEGGRSSQGNMPFFTLNAGTHGMAIAVGWSGQWFASFSMDDVGGVRVRAGMPETRIVLRPGESIRTPRIVLTAYESHLLRGNNLLRTLVYNHYTPLLSGKKPLPPLSCNTWFPVGNDGNKVTEQNQLEIIKVCGELGIEYVVVDAGWFQGGWPDGVGNWTPRPEAFPNGLKPLGDAARAAGTKLGLWFELERVRAGSAVFNEHPEWMLRLDGEDNCLLNMGIPEAQQWFVDTVSKYVDEVGLSYFRHDFNLDPLPYWQKADAQDRAGMTEIRYMEGLYKALDTLHAKYPDLLIEGCSSGGRRMDVEFLSRCHTYWRSDLYGDLRANQCHIFGASSYVPGNYLNAPLLKLDNDVYGLRSQFGGALCIGWDVLNPNFDKAQAILSIEKFMKVRHLFVGDFFPVIDYSLSTREWAAHQFNRGDLGEGLILFLRREESPYQTLDAQLFGLDPNRVYMLLDDDSRELKTADGRAICSPGKFSMDFPPNSRLYTYHPAPKQ